MGDEVRALVARLYARTQALLLERKDEAEAVAKMLLEKEVITTKDVVDCIGDRPFDMPMSYKEIVDSSWERDEEKSNMADVVKPDKSDETGGVEPPPAAAVP